MSTSEEEDDMAAVLTVGGLRTELGQLSQDIGERFDLMGERFDRVERALLPMAPALLHPPLKRLKFVVPPPQQDMVVPATWTVVDLYDNNGNTVPPSITRCVRGARHCALRVFIDARDNSGQKFLFFVELNNDIIRRRVKSVGVLKPARGNLVLNGQALADAKVVAECPSDDVLYVEVEDIAVGVDAGVPLIPNGYCLASLYGNFHQEKCVAGRSLQSDVSGHYGLRFEISVEHIIPNAPIPAGATVMNDKNLFETGVVKFVMSRCEKGNSGTVLWVVDAESGTRLFPIGVLHGLDAAHCSANQQHMLSRGVAAVCPQKKAFTDCQIVQKSDLNHLDGQTVGAIIGYEQSTKKTITTQARIELQDPSDQQFNAVQVSYQLNNGETIKRVGVICQSDVQIPYCGEAGFSFSPEVFAFG